MLIHVVYIHCPSVVTFRRNESSKKTKGTIQIQLRWGHRNAVGAMVLTHLPQPGPVAMPETVVLDAMHGVDHCPGAGTVGPSGGLNKATSQQADQNPNM